MNKAFLAVVITILLVLLVGCEEREKPIKTENVSGIVVNINGNYYRDTKEPLDCRVVTKVENTEIVTTYRVSYSPAWTFDDNTYNKCWKSLLLRTGDPVNVIKETWVGGAVTYSLDP